MRYFSLNCCILGSEKKFFHDFLRSMEADFPPPYMPTLAYSNHDFGRGISRIQNRLPEAKVLALIQLTARGIPVIYYGDEIGMGNHDLPLKDAKDPLAKIYRHIPKIMAKVFDIFINRDDARTPMQWDAGRNRKFTHEEAEPWASNHPRNGR